jgi:2-polyprenyl-6-methoxyphenol hydroxylase-like FAD-dependent oxidoreductase
MSFHSRDYARGVATRAPTASETGPTPYDVVIAGAGPVGLMLGCELALAGCSVLIVERAEQPHSRLKELPFGIRGLSAPTVEALHRRGMLEELQVPKRVREPHADAPQGAGRQAGHFAGIPFEARHVDATQWTHRVAGATDSHLIAELQELESVLSRRADSLGVSILRGHAVTGLHPHADGVSVACGERSFEGRFLVGCDGGRSAVRKLGGFDFPGTEPEFTGYSTHVDIVDPHKLRPGRNQTSTGLYLQSQPGFLVLQHFDGGAFHSSNQPITLQRVQDVLRHVSATDVTLSALHVATTWSDRARQVATYRQGRILLAGDAAHIHSPLGGQGLNLGLGDAMNLGWKLARTLQQDAPPGLLDSYHAERHPLGAQVLEWSRAQVLVMRPEPAARALHAVLRDLLNTRDGATYVAGRVWGVNARYDLGDDHPLVGRSVPTLEFPDGTTVGDCLRTGRGLLLDLQGHGWLADVAREYGDRIAVVRGQVRDSLGLGAVLVRPDGIVAWATDTAPDASSLRHAADRWFARVII